MDAVGSGVDEGLRVDLFIRAVVFAWQGGLEELAKDWASNDGGVHIMITGGVLAAIWPYSIQLWSIHDDEVR